MCIYIYIHIYICRYINFFPAISHCDMETTSHTLFNALPVLCFASLHLVAAASPVLNSRRLLVVLKAQELPWTEYRRQGVARRLGRLGHRVPKCYSPSAPARSFQIIPHPVKDQQIWTTEQRSAPVHLCSVAHPSTAFF